MISRIMQNKEVINEGPGLKNLDNVFNLHTCTFPHIKLRLIQELQNKILV